MDRIDIGIEMWYQYRYQYKKISNDMQPYAKPLPEPTLAYCQLDP